MSEFACPWALAGVLLLPLLWYYLVYLKKNPSIVVPSAGIFKRACSKKRSTGAANWLYLLALLLLIAALARPRSGDEKLIVRSKGIDIVLALDMSDSMRAIDVPANITSAEALAQAMNSGNLKNRLETAKEEIRKFILARPNDRIGLIGFADLAYSFSPPTLDHRWLLERLKTLEPGQLGSATGIASAISSGTRRLKNSKAPRRVLILFTDGANTVENRLTPEQSANLAKEFNCIIHTVGIGSSNAYIQTGYGFQKVPADFDEKLLSSISKITGGTTFRAADGEGMKKVLNDINALEKTNIEQPKYTEYKEYAPYLALAAALLILAGSLLENTFKLRIP